jgi:hypothetical protein
VVEHAVEDDPHAALVGAIEELAQRRVAAEQWIHRQVVVRVIAMVRGRLEHRGEVQRVHAQRLDVIEVLDDPEQVAALEPVVGRRLIPRLERPGLLDPRAPREPVREDLVEHCVADPGRRIGHAWDRRMRPRAPLSV